jgi:hypothetical protein
VFPKNWICPLKAGVLLLLVTFAVSITLCPKLMFVALSVTLSAVGYRAVTVIGELTEA